jgi:hypothetical protein
MFAEADLANALNDIGSAIRRKITAYLIGGCAMMLMGRKVATKDIDVVLDSTEDAKDLVRALQQLQFKSMNRVTGPYSALGAFAIMENREKMRFDVYNHQVCKALEISEGMKARASLYQSFGKLDVYLMSPEDIFLFKGITERDADFDDMRILSEVGLNWSTIERECLSQPGSGRWAYMLGAKLLDLRAKFSIESPIIKTLLDHADVDLLTVVFRQILGKPERSFKEIAGAVREKHGYSGSWTQRQLRLLVRNRIIGKKKAGRAHYYYMRLAERQVRIAKTG